MELTLLGFCPVTVNAFVNNLQFHKVLRDFFPLGRFTCAVSPPLTYTHTHTHTFCRSLWSQCFFQVCSFPRTLIVITFSFFHFDEFCLYNLQDNTKKPTGDMKKGDKSEIYKFWNKRNLIAQKKLGHQSKNGARNEKVNSSIKQRSH